MKHTQKKTRISYILTFACLLMQAEVVCNSTAVQLANINSSGGTIAEPGRYYLGWDVQGQIIIGNDNIILDLNGHSARRLSINGRKDVQVSNGTIDGTGLAANSNVVSIFGGSNNITISNLKVINGPASNSGIAINNSSYVFVNDCISQNNALAGCSIQTNCSNVFVNDCSFTDNSEGILISNSCNRVVVKRCDFLSNETNGAHVRANCKQVYFFECTANTNGDLVAKTGVGFLGETNNELNPINFCLFNCLAGNNGSHGFQTSQHDFFYFQSCNAVRNGNDGFNLNPHNPALVRECNAIQNDGCGINDLNCNCNTTGVCNTAAVYLGNYAAGNSGAGDFCNNGVNAGDNNKPYFNHAFDDSTAQFWRNIRSKS